MIYTEWDKYRDDMIKVGEEKDRNRLSQLLVRLKETGRLDDFAKAMEDSDYCDALLAEFSI